MDALVLPRLFEICREFLNRSFPLILLQRIDDAFCRGCYSYVDFCWISFDGKFLCFDGLSIIYREVFFFESQIN